MQSRLLSTEMPTLVSTKNPAPGSWAQLISTSKDIFNHGMSALDCHMCPDKPDMSTNNNSMEEKREDAIPVCICCTKRNKFQSLLLPCKKQAHEVIQGPLARYTTSDNKAGQSPPTAVLCHGILGSKRNMCVSTSNAAVTMMW